MFDVDFLGMGASPLSGNPDVAAADGFHPQVADLKVIGKGGKVHGVGVHTLPAFGRELDFGAFFAQNLFQNPIGAVTDAGFVQGTVQGYLEMVSLGKTLQKQQSGTLRAHGVGRGGAFADLVDLADGFHGNTSVFLFLICLV